MSYKKVIVSGNVVEVYEYQYAPNLDTKQKKDNHEKWILNIDYLRELKYFDDMERATGDDYTDRKTALYNRYFGDEVEGIRGDRKEERRKQTTRDARNKVRRLTLTNFNNHSKFITLTFKENLKNVKEANKIFKMFIRKLRERLMNGKKLRYVAVIEFQERGAVHYHMVCNIPFTKHEILYVWWLECIGAYNEKNIRKGLWVITEGGTVNIRDIKDVDNVGAYITKYMTKDIDDDKLQGQKCYLTSQGLYQPFVYKNIEANQLIYALELEKEKEIFTNAYSSEYLGNIVYKEYNLKQNEKYRKQKKIVAI